MSTSLLSFTRLRLIFNVAFKCVYVRTMNRLLHGMSQCLFFIPQVLIMSSRCHSNHKIPQALLYTGLSKKMDGIWNRYNLKSTGRIYTFGVLKYSEKFKVLDLL